MDRRDFLRLASLAGLGVVAGSLPFEKRARAGDTYGGPLWVFVNAGGGWDPTSFCDPKGTNDLMDPASVNHYLKSQIVPIGPFKVGPDMNGSTNIPFFTKLSSQLLVINGIDCATNSHDAGSRVTWSGTLTEGRPCLAALIAGVYGPSKPMSFITNGGYDTTAGVVALTRVANPDIIRRVAFPNRTNPSDDTNQETYFSNDTYSRIANARLARYQAASGRQQLPFLKKTMGTLYTARTGANELAALTQYLPATQQDGLKGQVDMAIAAFRAGICISCNLDHGGFDTHSNHDQDQYSNLGELFDGVSYLWDQAQQLIGGNVVIIMGSDFGRTPKYNDGRGKDHWSITSMMMLGKGIPGGRLIGATTDYDDPQTVDQNSLQVVGDSGVRITPGHVHKALRKLAGIDTNELSTQFPISDPENLNFFG